MANTLSQLVGTLLHLNGIMPPTCYHQFVFECQNMNKSSPWWVHGMGVGRHQAYASASFECQFDLILQFYLNLNNQFCCHYRNWEQIGSTPPELLDKTGGTPEYAPELTHWQHKQPWGNPACHISTPMTKLFSRLICDISLTCCKKCSAKLHHY